MLYICSPLSAPTQAEIEVNMNKAAYYCEVVSKMLGVRTIAPHSFLPKYMDDNVPEEREICLKFGIDILKISEGIVICGNRISNGMVGEITCAAENGIPLFFLKENRNFLELEDEKGAVICRVMNLETA